MKKIITVFACLILILFFQNGKTLAQNFSNKSNATIEWSTNNPYNSDVFVQNLGQFDSWAKTTLPIKYAVNNSDKVFFNQQGLIYRVSKFEDMSAEEREEIELATGKEPRPKMEIYYVNMQWEDCNADAVIEVKDETENYYTFGEKGYENVKAKGYKKLTYLNIYDGIDIEYIVPEKGGIKYSIILHPGADISKVKMKYTGNVDVIEKDIEGNIIIKTPAGIITDHAPLSFYQNGENIESGFELIGNTVSFQLQTTNNKQQTIIVDPWTTTPTSLTTDNNAYDIDYDYSGNVYVTGGTGPFKLAKYNSGGTLLWTYTNPLGWAGDSWYTKFCALQNSGSVFIGEGFTGAPRVMKINSSGSMVITSSSLFGNNEIWTMFYNRCNGQLMGFGGGTNNQNNLQIIADTNLTGSTIKNFNGYSGGCCNDVTSVEMDYNGDFYALMSSSLGLPSLNNHIQKSLISSTYNPPCAFDVSSGYNFQECDNYGIPEFNGGCASKGTVRSNALTLNFSYLFSYDGKTLKAWNKTSGAMLGSIIVDATYNSGVSRNHEGIVADECDNVYVGGASKVHVYSFNGSTFSALTPITTNIPNKVFDLQLYKEINTLYVCGRGFVTETPAINCFQNPLVTTTTVDTCTGSASVTVSGGIPPYTYIWSNGATTSSVTGLPIGISTVTVTDDACLENFKIDTVTITSSLVIDATGDSICSGETASISASGGATYLWSTSASTATITVSPTTTTTYTVTVSSGGGSCTAVLDVVVTVFNNLNVTASSMPSICTSNSGSTTANVTGGSGPYSYLWSPSGQTTATATALGAGTYIVTVTDQNGCTQTASAVVNSTSGLTANTTTVNVLCYGASTGSATVTAIGGTPSYTYLWSNTQTTPTATNLAAGTYTVSITDSDGCTTIQTATITEPTALSFTTSPSSICIGGNTNISATPSGGTSPYTYSWSSGESTAQISISPTVTTTYTTTVTDANGCTTTNSTVITVNPLPLANAGPDQAVCDGQAATLNASGGTTYAWSPSTGLSSTSTPNPTATPSTTTVYTLTVTDANGCTGTDTVRVGVAPLPVISVAGSPETCGRGDGTATISGSASYSYQWSNGQTTQTLTGLPQGTYSVTATDAGCTSTATVIVGNIPGPNAEFSAHPRILTILESDGVVSFLDNSSGNVVSWQWTLGDGSTASTEQFEHIYDEIGTYVVTLIVIDDNGCTDTTVDTIKVKDIFTIYIPNCITPDGNGYNDFFFPQGVNWDPDHFEMYIFDRWGELIYETKTIGDKWNGTVWNEGNIDDPFIDVYTYLIRVKELDGPKHEYIGRVTVVR